MHALCGECRSILFPKDRFYERSFDPARPSTWAHVPDDVLAALAAGAPTAGCEMCGTPTPRRTVGGGDVAWCANNTLRERAAARPPSPAERAAARAEQDAAEAALLSECRAQQAAWRAATAPYPPPTTRYDPGRNMQIRVGRDWAAVCRREGCLSTIPHIECAEGEARHSRAGGYTADQWSRVWSCPRCGRSDGRWQALPATDRVSGYR